MKKIALLIICLVWTSLTHAQIGSLIQRAARSTVNKTVDNVIDKTTDAASDSIANAITREIEKNHSTSTTKESEEATSEGYQTVGEVMMALPELPTVQQLVSYKTAEFGSQEFKMLTSPVTAFNGKAAMLSIQAANIACQNVDSTQAADWVYKNTEAVTGLSKEEIDELSTMSEEEQQEYLQNHYKQGTAEEAMLKNAEEASKYLEPLQPQIDRWDAVNAKVDELYEQTDAKIKVIYNKYESQLEKTSDAARNKILLKYYSEIAPMQREAVQKALECRLKEQLPIAEEIENEMVKIRMTHQDMISVLLNYPQLTSIYYFGEITRLLDIPEFSGQ
jgi:hypothetical protein